MVIKKKTTTKKVSKALKWKESKGQIGGSVVRWFDSNKGDIISIVTGNSPGNERIGIDGEIRVSIGRESFSIPCSLNIVKKMPMAEIVKVATRRYKEVKKYGELTPRRRR